MRLDIFELKSSGAIHIASIDLIDGPVSVRGLGEASRYRFALNSDLAVGACIDDLQIGPSGRNSSWEWDSGFCIGVARLEFINLRGEVISTVMLDITSDDGKLSRDELGTMLDDLLRWTPEKAAGGSSTALLLGVRGAFAANVLYERMRRFGPSFCRAIDGCRANPHSSFEARAQLVSIERVRRPSRYVVGDLRVIAYRESIKAGSLDRSAPVVAGKIISSTLDTPPNRSLLTLTKKVLRIVKRMTEVQEAGLNDAEEANRLRCARRIQILDGISSSLRNSVAWLLRAGVAEGENVADGLAQMGRMPAYARAVRLGKQACSQSFDSAANGEAELPLNSSWSLYEQWCFEQVRRQIEAFLGVKGTRNTRLFGLQAETYVFHGSGVNITFAAQVTFPSGSHLREDAGLHSLSKERRPDAVLVTEISGDLRWYIFDAKYRQSKANVLDAMSSAHIYRDSLFLRGKRCDGALLLTPGAAFNNNWKLFTVEHWKEFGSGVIPGFRPGGEGLTVMEDLIARITSPQLR